MGEAYKRDGRSNAGRRTPVSRAATTPTSDRRGHGTETRQRLLDAALTVFAERGYHAARVDDIVRAAETSHGTFYLYFANKEELLRELATACATDLRRTASVLQPADSTTDGTDVLGAFVTGFMATYARYGPVIRAWMEDQMRDGEIDRLGVRVFTEIAGALAARLDAADAVATPARRAR